MPPKHGNVGEVQSCVRHSLVVGHELVEKVTHWVATQLATLPHSHLLATHVQRAADRYIKKHRVPMHEVLHAFDMRLEAFKKIGPVRCNSKWEPKLKMHIPGSRETAMEDVRAANAEVQVYPGGS